MESLSRDLLSILDIIYSYLSIFVLCLLAYSIYRVGRFYNWLYSNEYIKTKKIKWEKLPCYKRLKVKEKIKIIRGTYYE